MKHDELMDETSRIVCRYKVSQPRATVIAEEILSLIAKEVEDAIDEANIGSGASFEVREAIRQRLLGYE